MKRNQSGFTLIEIAIVLVIIGLLLGGVLKGQELINSARVKNLATDFKNIPVFIYGYQDKFRALPGDDGAAASHVANATAATTNGTVSNGVIEGKWDGTDGDGSEAKLFWQHVRLAGLAPGSTTVSAADYMPTNATGGTIGIQSGTNCLAAGGSCTANLITPIKDAGGVAIRGSYVICSSAILGKFVKQLDLQMDDGNTASGSMMAMPVGSAAATSATATASIDDAASYTVCMGV
ncbi:MAG: prepilin-type N-terminal cleavage/methylation domain-containing protein [Nitrosomonadales bacterium]|nr:prepilin-type N-terminal cleavage/methylation domain-containing protein [Nitrosomonadales bacterium]